MNRVTATEDDATTDPAGASFLQRNPRLRRELLILAWALGTGLIVMPILIYVVGLLTLGPYASGGWWTLFADLYAGLFRGWWAAWLWWDDRWNLLTAQYLPIGGTAFIEQYVEVHVDATRPTRIDVPAVTVDNVQLRPADGGSARYWRSDVPTLTGYHPGEQQRSGGFCLDWVNQYDTWTAGDCRQPPSEVTHSPACPEPGRRAGRLAARARIFACTSAIDAAVSSGV